MTEATSSTSDGSIDAVLVRAARLSDLGRPRAAIAVLASALRVDPGHPVAWCRLSAAYLDIGEARESLDAAKRAMTLGEPAWAHRLASLALVELSRRRPRPGRGQNPRGPRRRRDAGPRLDAGGTRLPGRRPPGPVEPGRDRQAGPRHQPPRRRPPPPAASGPHPNHPRFERVHRISWYLAVRR